MLIAHRPDGDANLAVVEFADQRIDLGSEDRVGEFLGKASPIAAPAIGG
jgi:hypothetical protein